MRLAVLTVGVIVLNISGAACSVDDLVLWGVDARTKEIFSVGDYTDLSGTATVYNALKWFDNGKLKKINKKMEAFALDADGVAYIAVRRGASGKKTPVLLTFDTKLASTTDDNIATVLGPVKLDSGHRGDRITGLSIDPVTGELYGLYRTRRRKEVDRLIIIDKTDASVTAEVGNIEGLGAMVTDGQGITFGPGGIIFVTDKRDSHLYEIDKHTATILRVIDDNMGKRSRYESLAWDYSNGILVGTDNHARRFALISLTDGDNQLLENYRTISLRDVEGLSFAPVPEPTTLWMLALGSLAMLAKRRRRQSSN